MARYNKNRASSLPARKRKVDPMAAFDALPAELRAWLRGAKLPWSAQSCHKIWLKTRARGASATEALARLDQVEMATLARETIATPATLPRSGGAGL